MTFLVTGATGKQGGSVARQLLAKGHPVRALTRSTSSAAAQELARLGATLVTGDMGDPASLQRAADGARAIFSVSTSFEGGVEAETIQGVNVANAAKAAKAYLVYTSVANADKQTKIPHFDSKYEVEKHIRDIGISAAILGPAYFMDNLLTMGRRMLAQGRYATPLSPNRVVQQISTGDIGAFAVLALENEARFAGKRLDIASDELTGAQSAEIMARILGEPIAYQQTPMDPTSERSIMYAWLERVGYSADVAALRRDYPELHLHTFEEWAKAQDWKTLIRS
jgi:uncharacterized protein YbjT (DUF2867 family)